MPVAKEWSSGTRQFPGKSPFMTFKSETYAYGNSPFKISLHILVYPENPDAYSDFHRELREC